jgi:Cu(I)/Ag(I) efflux system membrane fusion protein
MSEEAKALADIQTTEVRRQWVVNQVALTGVIDYDETRLSTISAYIDGRLDRLYVDYTGIDVRKGDHMVRLFSRNLLTAMEELVLAKQAYKRAQKSNVSDLQTYINDIEGSRERLRLWGLTAEQIEEIERSDRREDHITIYSPIAGTVVKKHVNEGEYVKTGSPIYTVADFSHVWLKLKAYETDLPWLHYGQDVEFTTESYPGEVFHGRISFIDPMLDQMSRTVNVRVNVLNEDKRLKPGMFVRARVKAWVAGSGKVIAPDLTGKWISPMHPEVIKDGPGSCDVCGMALVPAEELGYVSADEETAPLVIPASAPLITGKRAVVYVRAPGEDRPTFEGREITLGSRAGDYYLVKEGLAEGEKVVTNGAFKIDSALQIVAKPSMMNPERTGGMTDHEHSSHKH